MSGIRWTEDEVNAYLARNGRISNGNGPNSHARRKVKGKGSPAVSAAYMEPGVGDGARPAHAGQKMDSKFRVRIHSLRRRGIDPDGLYSQAAIDGLTEGGILKDDNAEVVESVSYSQERAKDEATIIEVWEIVK